MGILSALRAPAQDTETDQALADIRAFEKRKSELLADAERLHAEVATEKRKLAEASFAGDEAAGETAQRHLAVLDQKLSANKGAIQLAEEKIRDARRRLHLANAQGYLRTARRLANKRSKYATEASDALKTYLHARAKLQEANGQMVTSFPISGSEPPAGSVATLRELDNLISRELLRLQGGSSFEQLAPGTLANPFLSITDLIPLADEIEQANKHYLETIEAGPPVGAVQEAVLAPAVPDPDAELLSGTAERTFSIQDATALMTKPTPTILIDNRKGSPNEPAA